MQTMSLDQLERMQGADVYSEDGEKIGSVEEVYVDEQTRRPEWIGLGTGFFGTKRVLVPVEGASLSEDQVTVPYAKDHVKDAPDVDAEEIDQATEGALYAHYGLGYSEARSDTGLPEGRSGSEDLADTMKDRATMTRSEEELQVGKREQEMGRLRVHKWVETEQVDVPVEVRREKARVTKEPVDETVASGDIGEESLDVTLREERPVVQKETVAKEKIRVDKDVDVEQETVSEELRKERVDVDDSSRP